MFLILFHIYPGMTQRFMDSAMGFYDSLIGVLEKVVAVDRVQQTTAPQYLHYIFVRPGEEDGISPFDYFS